MSYHVIIAIDKRKDGREAISVSSTIATPKNQSAVLTQLHSMADEINVLGAPNLLYVAQNMGKYVKMLKGAFGEANMAFAGWPMTDVDPDAPRPDQSLPVPPPPVVAHHKRK